MSDPKTASSEGIVVRVRPRKVWVEIEGRNHPAFLRGSLSVGPRRTTHVVAVGDRVKVSRERGRYAIEEVLPRRNVISRVDPGSTKRDIEHVMAANLDWFVVVVSLAQPALNFRGLDRFLVLGEISDIPCAILLNKDDVAEAYDPSPEEVYARTGYPLIRTSAKEGTGLAEVRELLQNRVSLLAGPSGVGKSSLLNAIFPGLELPTQPVSDATGKGVHTTTRVEWVPIPGGGALLDSPGVRSIQPFGLTGENLDLCVPELARLHGGCQFNDCKHREEPGCAVRAAVEAGEVSESRYEGYCRILQGVDKPEWWRRSIGS
ncbi:MAG: ribosome small subunit-dependent GTPase A [Candidatus Eisenbacteria bacterium]